MRNLVLATVSVVALGLAAPVYAQGNTGTSTANPATATPSTTAPANPSAQPTEPQTGATTESTQGAMSGGSQYGTSPYMANSGSTAAPSGAMHLTRSDVRQAQQQLKAEGLYRGKVDGKDGPKTRAAIRQFQKKNGLPVTARLDENTMNQLGGAGMNQNMGQGSSMPPSGATNMTPPASSDAGTTGSSSPNTGTTTGTSYK
jgi:peptidoglycan hydrolase-like protein with peptidoglycan-binding domain